MPLPDHFLKKGGPGRPRGLPNRATREFKELWASWLESDEYRENLKRRILLGRAPHMESYLAQLVFGKPKDIVEQTGELVIRCELNE